MNTAGKVLAVVLWVAVLALFAGCLNFMFEREAQRDRFTAWCVTKGGVPVPIYDIRVGEIACVAKHQDAP